jgi:hypothetical protein
VVHTPEYDEAGRLVRVVVESEPEYDEEQYQMLVALSEHEGSLNELGIPIDEAMSALADPNNPQGTHRYKAVGPARDWSLDALEQAQKDPQYAGENYSRARRWDIERVDR